MSSIYSCTYSSFGFVCVKLFFEKGGHMFHLKPL